MRDAKLLRAYRWFNDVPDGQLVLDDLMKQFEGRKLVVPGDSLSTGERVGELNVVNYIKARIADGMVERSE